MSINEKIETTLTITDAYYSDLDQDEVLDVISYFNLQFDSACPHLVRIYVSLILPSGFEFSYKWIILSKQLVYYGQIHFYDHAIESGVYILQINALLSTGGLNSGLADYEFDPPGGSGGGDPCARLM
ncbi:MAG: hypothetical protein JSW11_17000 [Candidatus Heimdallarchaeota archaeon]|nr:MAG: hypothetical protein JSW11_17000 [Candidatus Heimdallarchaeota archaeon]